MKRGVGVTEGPDGDCAAIILAAGASTRMGAVKALLPLENGEPAVCHLARLYEMECGFCIVVTGYHAEAVEAAIERCGYGYAVRNPEPERGQLSSLQCGLRALAATRPRLEWFLFTPVDFFDVTPESLRVLRSGCQDASPDTLFCIPEYMGKHGHPIAARWSMAEEFLDLPVSETARTVVRRHRARSLYVTAPDAGILADYDTPAAFQRRAAPAEGLPRVFDEPPERSGSAS
ncbi:MAG: nucleotidyltransferase family protein [Bryobacterales bacterium]|nr:nucleotidyltransferase family protein [Bryobacterales bacterium]